MDEEILHNQDSQDGAPEPAEKPMGPAPETIRIPNPTYKTPRTPVPGAVMNDARNKLVQKVAKDTYVQKPNEEKKITNFAGKKATKILSESAPVLPVPEEASRGRDDVIRTYQSDVEDTVRNQKLSLTNIAIAENRRRFKEDPSTNKETKQKSGMWKRVFLNILSSVIMSASVGLLAFLYLQYQDQRAFPTTVGPINTLALANNSVSINIAGATRTSLLKTLEKVRDESDGNLGDVLNITLTPDETLGSINAMELFKLLEAESDSALLRSIEDEFMLGLHLIEKPQYFLVVKTSFFENAFTGMLRWEKTIADELPFLVQHREIPKPVPIATSTQDASTTAELATSTVENKIEETVEFTFEDIVIENKDVRARSNIDGEIDILYTFIDPETLLITNNTNTMKAIFDRLTIARFKQ